MRQAIGIDVGGTNIRAALVSGDGRIIKQFKQPTPRSPKAVVAKMDSLITQLGAGEAIGVGLPCRVDGFTGKIEPGGYVDLSREPLVRHLKQTHARPLFIDNDGAMALVAEARIGAARNIRNAVLLTIGTGIGGATMISGQIIHGQATAGQLGHVTVDMNGDVCNCGRRGCIETKSSGTALRKLIAAAGHPFSTTIEDLLQSGSPIIAAWAAPLRQAIDSIAAVADPELVVLGGGLGAAAFAALESFPRDSTWFKYSVAPAALGDDAGVIGAALSALEQGK